MNCCGQLLAIVSSFTKCNKTNGNFFSSAIQGIKTEAQKMWCCIFRGGNDSFSSLFKMNLIFWVLEKMFLFEWQTSGSHSKRQMSHDVLTSKIQF